MQQRTGVWLPVAKRTGKPADHKVLTKMVAAIERRLHVCATSVTKNVSQVDGNEHSFERNQKVDQRQSAETK